MKKTKIIFIALIFVAAFSACEDNTGTYVSQLFTNTQKDGAFRTCLTSSLDSAVNHLCTYDGFYQYNDAAYRINYSQLQNSVFDTLYSHDKGYLCDSLVLYTNRLAENCNSQVKSAFTNCIKSVVFDNYDALWHGDDDAITNCFELQKRNALADSLKSPVAIRMNLFNVNETWKDIVIEYNKYNDNPVNIDLQSYIVNKMLDAMFEEMRLEEFNIRTDSTHRVSADSLLGL